MSAAAIIQKAREDGLSLAVTERDTIKVLIFALPASSSLCPRDKRRRCHDPSR
jgi:hypothetical protein